MWIPANSDHIPLIQNAFEILQQNRANSTVSYLAESGVLDFHRDRIIQKLENTSTQSGINLFMSNQSLLALIGVEKSPWHSRHFNVSYQKIQPFFCFASEPDQVGYLVNELTEYLATPNTLYTMRIEAHHHALAYRLTQHGFTPVGTSIRLIREGEQSKCVDSISSNPYDSLIIRPCRNTDIPKLQEVIRGSHRYSHFFCEQRFDPQRVRDLFAEWIAQCATNPAFEIRVAEQAGEIIGFCSAFIQKSLKPYIQRSIGIIDFIVVDYRIQGKGIGRVLLEAAADWFRPDTDSIELRTMADNLQAIRFYEKNGFRMLSADIHFHRWTY